MVCRVWRPVGLRIQVRRPRGRASQCLLLAPVLGVVECARDVGWAVGTRDACVRARACVRACLRRVGGADSVVVSAPLRRRQRVSSEVSCAIRSPVRWPWLQFIVSVRWRWRAAVRELCRPTLCNTNRPPRRRPVVSSPGPASKSEPRAWRTNSSASTTKSRCSSARRRRASCPKPGPCQCLSGHSGRSFRTCRRRRFAPRSTMPRRKRCWRTGSRNPSCSVLVITTVLARSAGWIARTAERATPRFRTKALAAVHWISEAWPPTRRLRWRIRAALPLRALARARLTTRRRAPAVGRLVRRACAWRRPSTQGRASGDGISAKTCGRRRLRLRARARSAGRAGGLGRKRSAPALRRRAPQTFRSRARADGLRVARPVSHQLRTQALAQSRGRPAATAQRRSARCLRIVAPHGRVGSDCRDVVIRAFSLSRASARPSEPELGVVTCASVCGFVGAVVGSCRGAATYT